jgi:hypothetical protein
VQQEQWGSGAVSEMAQVQGGSAVDELPALLRRYIFHRSAQDATRSRKTSGSSMCTK